ncbi:MAG: Nif3-like dinuclear metal center hexameric protein [Candidatus Bipolaricaulota bacterium]
MLRQDVVAFLDERFPPTVAEEWDRSGLQVGPLDAPCRRAVVALDFGLDLVGRLQSVDLVVTHHPLLFRPLDRVLPETPLGAKLEALLLSRTACYAVHTPYDSAQGGLGEVLAGCLGLGEVRPLAPRGRLVKLVVFVPHGHEDAMADALFRAGAGKIGNYGRCSFRAPGVGTFLAGPGTRPFLGEVGKEEHADEARLETIVPGERLPHVLRAMREAHPYEEVAYDVYPLENAPSVHGLGRVGELPHAMEAGDVMRAFGRALGEVEPQAVYGELDREVRRVAVCGGSGGDLWEAALRSGADLYLTGELGYHHGLASSESGLTAVAFGHRETERPFVAHVGRLLRERFPDLTVEER